MQSDISAFPNEMFQSAKLDLLLGFQKRRLEICSGIHARRERAAGLIPAVFVCTQVSTGVAPPALASKIHVQCLFSSHAFLSSDRAASDADEMRIAAACSL